jgi:hypothetical protein
LRFKFIAMRLYLKLTCIFLFLTLLTSCEKNDASTKTKGDISGKVALYDEGTASLPNEGMSVRIMNLNPEITASTDASGSFTLKDVPYGNYRLLLEKDGYGPYQWADIVHEKSNTSTILTNTVSLGKISSTQVTDMSVVVSGNNVFLQATTNPAGSTGNRRYVRFFFHTDENVSKDNYKVFSETFVLQQNPSDKVFNRTEWQAMGFPSGTRVYVKAYGDSFWSNSYIEAGANNKTVFPNLNSSSAAAASFIVP